MGQANFYEHNLNPFIPVLEIPYYWMVYSLGLVFVWWSGRNLIKKGIADRITEKDFIDYLLIAWVGMLLGSRLFYVFIYNYDYFKDKQLEILYFWRGGMSFHGGVLGASLALWLTSSLGRKRSSLLSASDLAVLSIPLVLAFGRIANFINGELAGRVSYVPWAVIFPRYNDGLPRHPSQIYEALAEGLILYVILGFRKKDLKIPGRLSSYFLMGYACMRFFVEFFRLPDPQIGYIGPLELTLGQSLCLAMFVLGLGVYWVSRKHMNSSY